MMANRMIWDIGGARLSRNVGSKAENLHFLARHRYRTPTTYVCTWEAYERYRQGDDRLERALRLELSSKLDLDRRYAVRSSANVEDASDHSFAGQFKTFLDLQGLDGIVAAIRAVWASTRGSETEGYLQQVGIRPEDLKMGVLIQEMVTPAISGVSFSKNPVTGADEVIVEAVEGRGDALVQAGVTPLRWTYRWDSWTHRPEVDDADYAVVQDVVSQTRAIERDFGKPIDLEWVFDGQRLYWVQLREIKALTGVNLYSNRAARDVLPGIILPLVWSVNVPIVNGAWIRLITEIIGSTDLGPFDLAKSFYYRAYFNMGAMGSAFEQLGLPGDFMQRLRYSSDTTARRRAFKPGWRTLTLLPRLIWFAWDKVRFARKIPGFLARTGEELQGLEAVQVADLTEAELLRQVTALSELNRESAYYSLIAIALQRIHTARLRRGLKRAGIDLESRDLTGGLEALHDFDPAYHLRRLARIYGGLSADVQGGIRGSSFDRFSRMDGAEVAPLQNGIASFLEHFGHLSDNSNDFSSIPWREDPDSILRLVTDYPEAERSSTFDLEELDLSRGQRARLAGRWRQARSYRLHREAIGYLFARGFGLFRLHFLALGARLAERGLIEDPADIFYLYLDEVQDVVTADGSAESAKESIDARKREIQRVRDIDLPEIVYGDDPPPIGHGVERSTTLEGTPTSRGYYSGPVRIVRGIKDFPNLQAGDVLVVPYSDVGLTPLFARAGAVVAESGGMLSHSSIVAREYGIPAVVSVRDACRILRDGQIAAVDGYTGAISVIEKPEVNEERSGNV
ncbi:MAG: PEP/pyruvate-binding domain-containing protein [Anaerolineae bacterium]|jgi:pyruvate,water dikinase